jgi:hypothetical protein
MVARVQGWPISAASTVRPFRDARHAAEGDARGGDGAALHRDVEGAADGGDVLIEAFRQLVDPQPVGLHGDGHGLDEFARGAVLLAVVEEEVLQRQVRVLSPLRRCSVAPSAISGGGLSPMGEPLAMLPPTVAAFRTCTEP